MNELQKFEFEGSNIRTVIVDGIPYWVAKDVCDILGLTNPTESVKALDEDEKSTLRISEGGMPINIINESGLYYLIIRSNKPDAKRFRKWITSEVLPQIRETGKYEMKEKELTRKEILLMALKAEEEKEALQLVVNTQQGQLAEQQPKVDFANKLLKSKDCILVREFAKVITDEGFKIGEKELFKWFRENGYLSYKKNEPFQQYMKYFNLKETTVNTVYGNQIFKTPVVTPEGQLYFFNKIMNEFKPLFDSKK
jgi:anti-repressor protein